MYKSQNHSRFCTKTGFQTKIKIILFWLICSFRSVKASFFNRQRLKRMSDIASVATSLLREDRARCRKEWASLSAVAQKERWRIAFSVTMFDVQAWFEQDMQRSPTFFLSYAEQSISLIELFGESHGLGLMTRLLQERRRLYDYHPTLWMDVINAPQIPVSLATFTSFVIFKKVLEKNTFAGWWNAGTNGKSAFVSHTHGMRDVLCEARLECLFYHGKYTTLEDLRDIVRSSNWRTGGGCGTPELTRLAFGPRAVNYILCRLSRNDSCHKYFDMAGLKTFLLEDGGYDFRDPARDLENGMEGEDEEPAMYSIPWYMLKYRRRNHDFREWMDKELGRFVDVSDKRKLYDCSDDEPDGKKLKLVTVIS